MKPVVLLRQSWWVSFRITRGCLRQEKTTEDKENSFDHGSVFYKRSGIYVCISKDFLNKEDRVLFIDDFLANGNAANGIISLIEQAGAQLVGMGFIIEKAFQHGGELLRKQGIHVESLAIIDSLDNCQIKIR